MTQTLKRSNVELQNAVYDELQWIPSIDSVGIEVVAVDGVVTLSGQVRTYPEILLAVKAAKRVRGVTGLAEELTVSAGGPGIEDADIAAEAIEALRRAIDVPAAVHAAVSAGAVTLSGEVQWQPERESAARAVRYLRGVVTIHNRITIRPTASAAGLDEAIVAALVRSAQLRGKNISVTTDRRGHVTLNGTVGSWADRSQAEHACWAAPGITDVHNELRLVF